MRFQPPRLATTATGRRARTSLFAAWFAVIGLAGIATGQEEEDPQWKTDPYTQNDEAAMSRAGYLSFGPFPWADRHGTARIEETIGRIEMRWIETEHFKIGCSLTSVKMPRDKDARKKLVAELKELATTLPNLNPKKVKRIDRWLRAHLFAHRLEKLHREMSEALLVSDENFDPAGQRWTDGRGMGRGKHFGVRGKFLVMLCEKETTCGRYAQTFAKTTPDTPTRWYYPETDCFYFGTAMDFSENAFAKDEAMHAHVVFNVAHCMLDAFRGYNYYSPSWWKEGLVHRFRRAVSTEHNMFSQIDEGDSVRPFTIFDWDVKVRQRLGHGLVRPLEEILDVAECKGFKLVDHMACWSRVEYLIDRDARAFAEFIHAQRALVDNLGNAMPEDQRAKRQREALERVLGFEDATALDTAWAAWAKKTYKNK